MFQLPNVSGRSRQGLPVRAIHNTASTNIRLSDPVRPGSVGLPRQCGAILRHWASVRTVQIILMLPQKELESRLGFNVNPDAQQGLVRLTFHSTSAIARPFHAAARYAFRIYPRLTSRTEQP